ncbi:DoxX family protein [Rhodococcus sp. NPDC058521]|uniref:DoxX family protein n=1 Tax=Rhodococcus sp. NPDC058521 TaxID=3346536 RepID=UPI00366757DF
MSTVATPVKGRSRVGIKVGWVLMALLTLFFLFDAFGKLTKAQAVKDSLPDLGIPESIVVWIGVVLLVCTILYVIPATAFLGAVLLTGYLGGAVFTHMRVEGSLFGETLFPVYVGIVVWGALYLRDKRVRDVMPFTR